MRMLLIGCMAYAENLAYYNKMKFIVPAFYKVWFFCERNFKKGDPSGAFWNKIYKMVVLWYLQRK